MRWEKKIDDYYGEYKKGGIFGKKYPVEIQIYPSTIEGVGFVLYENRLSDDTYSFEITYKEIHSLYMEKIENENAIFIEYAKKDSIVSNSMIIIVLIGITDTKKWFCLIEDTMNAYLEDMKKEEQSVIDALEEQRQFEIEKEEKALKFYQDCYSFHIKGSRPVYQLFSDKNKAALIYIDETKSLNFLKIDGYEGEESNGIISYENIHYYEKAGNISYATDIHGNYESFGGSMTGGKFSKLATVGGGIMFGLMGMALGAALTYKPAERKPAQASFSIDSDIKKIDDRSVMLNFYSDAKKQYIDIELPQGIYNFLQTYLPEKKYGIVDELEKKTVVHQSAEIIENGSLLKFAAKSNNQQIEMKEKREDPMEAFKQKVEKLKMMKEAALLSDEEFEAEKKKLLNML